MVSAWDGVAIIFSPLLLGIELALRAMTGRPLRSVLTKYISFLRVHCLVSFFVPNE